MIERNCRDKAKVQGKWKVQERQEQQATAAAAMPPLPPPPLEGQTARGTSHRLVFSASGLNL